jgi:aminoglycoside 2'-N-acetyltransferase I
MINHKLTLEIIPRNQLSEVESAEIITTCSHAFEEDIAPYLAVFEDPIHILARLEGVLVSHALWITRWLQIGTGPMMRAAYVEAVATEERYRGQGFATAVMECLAAEITDFDIGGLSPAETSLYARLGWETWQGPLFHRKDGQLIPDPADEVFMILRLPKTPDLDLSLPISVEWRQGEIW